MTLVATDYTLTISDLIKNFIQDNEYSNYFKNFFYGNPEQGIPLDQCPCIVVVKEDSDTSQGPTGMDFVKENIMIRVVLNKRHYGDSVPLDEVMTQREFEELVEGIDAVTGEYSPNCIKGILRKNFTLGNEITNQTINISYGKVINPAIDEVTRECQIKVYIEYYVMTTSKQ